MMGPTRHLRSRGKKASTSIAATGDNLRPKRRVFGDVSNRNPNAYGDEAKSVAKKTANALHTKNRLTRSNNIMPKKETLRNILVQIGGTANPVTRAKGAPKSVDNANPKDASKVAAKKKCAQLSHTLGNNDADMATQRITRSAARESLPEGTRRTRSSSRNKSEGSCEAKVSVAGSKRTGSKGTNHQPAKRMRRSLVEETQNDQIETTKSKANERTMGSHVKRRSHSAGRKPNRDPRPETRVLCSDFHVDSNYTLVRAPLDSSKYTTGISKHDVDDKENLLAVSDYVTDMFQRLYHAETAYRPRMYMEDQDEINAMMRAILINWLVEVHMKFKLVPETLYLCINIIDRYCSLVEVERRKLQLVGVTALLVACKYEEIYPPEVRDCVYVTDRAYTRQDVLDMEQKIVKALEFKLTVPTGYVFLLRYLCVTKASELTRAAANYYMERTLQDYEFIQFRPSLVASAAVCLALNNPQVRIAENLTGQKPGITDDLVEYTGYTRNEIYSVACKIAEIIEAEVVTASQRSLLAVKKKYDTGKYFHVSTDVINPDIRDLL